MNPGHMAAIVILGIGLRRVYLGYQWTTDVLAGWVLGLSILSLAVMAATIWSRPASAELSRPVREATALEAASH